MAVPPRRWAAELLHVWFHELSPRNWFGSSAEVDAMLRRKFAPDYRALSRRPAAEFLGDLRLAQAAILLFDQIPRNIFRDTRRAFAADPLARDIAINVLNRGWDTRLPARERQFIAMPLMHSENIADQRISLSYFAQNLPGNLSFARSHHRMIARFGRFPHRNRLLGRNTAVAERHAIANGFSW
jgi:uncharacterized protein (DUF924 family)